jgi:hypothetical protein
MNPGKKTSLILEDLIKYHENRDKTQNKEAFDKNRFAKFAEPNKNYITVYTSF